MPVKYNISVGTVIKYRDDIYIIITDSLMFFEVITNTRSGIFTYVRKTLMQDIKDGSTEVVHE